MPSRLVAAGPALLAAAVLVATVIAFAVAERIKLEPSPILQPNVGAQLSPVCRCPQRVVPVAFTVRRGGTVAVKVVDSDGDVVRHLDRRRHYGSRERVALTWDGRDDRDRRVPDGRYRPRIELGRRTIVMPNTIVVDARPPALDVTAVSRRTISPDGDGRSDAFTVDYTTDEPARASLFVDGKRYERKKRLSTGSTFRWNGRLGGRDLPPGRHVLRLRAGDPAGNVSRWSRPIAVRVRFLEVAPHLVRASGGSTFRIRVVSDARVVAVTLDGRRRTVSPGAVTLRAPRRAGRYLVTVSANGHRAALILRVPRPAKPRRAKTAARALKASAATAP